MTTRLFIAPLVLVFLASIYVDAQLACSNGIQVYQRSPSNSAQVSVHADRIIEVATSEVPTSACERVCDSTPSCRSFSVDYTTRTCKIYSVTVPRAKLIQRPGAAFFEKICLPNASADRIRRRCGSRMWAVDRVSGLAFNSFVNRLEADVANRETCIRSCLEETAFDCASVTYDDATRDCALSAEDRHTQPAAIAENARSSNYYENQCVNNLVECRFIRQQDLKVVSVDYVTVARSEDECRDDCQKNAAIICRSYSYEVAQNSCSLSSDNSKSLLSVELPTQNGHLYGERQCLHSAPSVFGTPSQSPSSSLSGSNFPAMASFASNQFVPASGSSNVFGFEQFQQPTGRFGNFDNSRVGGGSNPNNNNNNNFFTQNMPPSSFNPMTPTTNSFGGGGGGGGVNNPFFSGPQGSGQPFDGGQRFPQGTSDPRIFGANPRDPAGFNNNNQFSNGFPPVSDGCSLEKSTGLTVMPDPRGMIPTEGLGRGVTVQCAILCRLQGPIQCPAFTLDYSTNRCVVLNRPAETALSTGSTPTQSYFEQVCYTTVYRSCQGKAWAFERIVNMELRGSDDRTLPSIASRRDCEEACLKETQFPCLSAEYDGNRLECRLSRDSRLTRSYALQQSPNVEYLENQCVPISSSSACSPARQQGQAVFYVDASIPQVSSEEECKRICRALPNFTCVAASYSQTTRDCQLSNDVTVFSQPDSVLLYSSCMNLVQVAPPNFANTGQTFGGNTFGNQFPGSFNPPGFTGRGSNNFGGFGGSSFPQSPSAGFTPNQFQFQGNLNPGFSQQGPAFLNPATGVVGGGFNPLTTTAMTTSQQFPQQFFGTTGSGTFPSQQSPFGFVPTFQNQNPQLFGTGATNFPNSNNPNPQIFGRPTGTSSFIPQQQTPQFFGTFNPQQQQFPTTSFGTFSTPDSSFSTFQPSFGFPQSGFSQSGFPQSGFPQSGFPQSGFPQSGFPQSGFPQSGFPQSGLVGQQNPFGVPLIPGGIPQQQQPPFPSTSFSGTSGRFSPNFQQRTASNRSQNQRSSSSSSSSVATNNSSSNRANKRANQDGDVGQSDKESNGQDGVYISWGSQSRNRKPIRNAPRFLRADPTNATQTR